jgi:Short C-terminal domain
MGILKTAATVAVASSVHGRVQRRQQARWAAQDQQAGAGQAPPPQQPPPQQQAPQQSQVPAAAAQPDDMADRLANLAKLGELMNAGLLTQAEFDQQKARILSG